MDIVQGSELICVPLHIAHYRAARQTPNIKIKPETTAAILPAACTLHSAPALIN